MPGWVLRSGGFEAGITIRDFNLNSGVSYRGLAAKRHVRDNEVRPCSRKVVEDVERTSFIQRQGERLCSFAQQPQATSKTTL